MRVNHIISLLKILIDLCSIKHCIATENIFLVIVYSLLVAYGNNCFKINGKQKIKIDSKAEIVKFKNFARKIKSPFIIDADFEIFQCPKTMESKIQMRHIQITFKIKFFVVMVTN